MSRRLDYVPDLADVRGAYARQVSRQIAGASMSDRRQKAADEFDRWYTRALATAWADGHHAGLKDAVSTGPNFGPARNPYVVREDL